MEGLSRRRWQDGMGDVLLWPQLSGLPLRMKDKQVIRSLLGSPSIFMLGDWTDYMSFSLFVPNTLYSWAAVKPSARSLFPRVFLLSGEADFHVCTRLHLRYEELPAPS